MEAFVIFAGRTLRILICLIFLLVLTSMTPAMAQYSLYRFREFTVTLEKYPPGKNPYTSAVITLDGKGVYHRTIKGQLFEIDRTKSFKVSVKQLEFLYYKIMRNNFFEIGEKFGNPNMQQGNIIKVTVKIDNQLHSVTMFDERFLAVQSVIDAILEVMPKDYAKTFKDDYDGSGDRYQINID